MLGAGQSSMAMDDTMVELKYSDSDVVKFASDVENTRSLNSDEFVVSFSNQG